MRYFKSHLGDFCLIGFFILMTIAPLLEQDYPLNHSSHFNLSWAFQYQRQFFAGQFYPRWLEYSNFGFGNATFVFYPPLSLVATLPFAALGWSVSASLIGSTILALLVFALGIHRYSRCFFRPKLTLFITLLALFNPYLLIDIYLRGAIAEVWAIAWIPWILLATHQLIHFTKNTPHPPTPSPKKGEGEPDQSPSPRWGEGFRVRAMNSYHPNAKNDRFWRMLQLATFYSLLILSHLPTLLLFTLVWWLIPWLSTNHKTIEPFPKVLQIRLMSSYGSFLLALGFTSFYLAPVLFDLRLVQSQQLHPDPDYFPQNRLLFTGLTELQPEITAHWFDRTLVPYTIVVMIIVLCSSFAWCLRSPNSRNPMLNQSVMWWGGITGLVVLMMTDFSLGLYELAPLTKIQFSWRWLSLTVVTVPLLWGYLSASLPQLINDRFRRTHSLLGRRLPRINAFNDRETGFPLPLFLQFTIFLGSFTLALILFVQSNQIMDQTKFEARTLEQFNQLSQQKPFPAEPQALPKESFLHWHWRFADGLGLGDVYEYRSLQVNLNLPPDRSYPLLQWSDLQGSDSLLSPSFLLQQWSYGKRSFAVTNPTNANQGIQLRMLYYPGWQFQIDNQPWRSVHIGKIQNKGGTEQGVAEIPIPPGEHQVRVWYRGTRAEQAGLMLTGATLCAITILWGWNKFPTTPKPAT